MSRDWKPGDIALIFGNDGGQHVALRQGVESNMGWAWSGTNECGSTRHWAADSQVTPIRPLVVIDPEDAEQVGALTRAHCAFWEHAVDDFVPEEAVAMQEALRSLVTPPNPDEPTGLGAVVEADDGYLYVRHYAQDDGDHYEHVWHVVDRSANKPRVCWKWSEITPVRVLSEGVTA